MQIHGYAALSPKSPLVPFAYEAPPLQPYEVLLKVSHCGVCRTDLHMIDNNWGRSTYPLLPGHEVVGHIVQKGASSSFRLGTRVAAGWVFSSCLACEECQNDKTNICQHKTSLYNKGRFGGFADHVIADSRFCFALPDPLSSADAAPFLCAGATVFAPLKHYITKPNASVGIIGIGGLGHLALQFAKALGGIPSAISSSSSKEDLARKWGAHHFYTLPNRLPAPMQFDLLLCTVDVAMPWDLLLSWLKPEGVLCLVSRPPKESFQFDPALLVSTQRVLAGSNNANRATIYEMLDFATQHNIRPQIELYPLKEVNVALERLRQNQARYRIVLQINEGA